MPALDKTLLSASSSGTASQYNNLLSALANVFIVPGSLGTWVVNSGYTGTGGGGGMLSNTQFTILPPSGPSERGQWIVRFQTFTASNARFAHPFSGSQMVRFYGNSLIFNTGSANDKWAVAPTGTAFTDNVFIRGIFVQSATAWTTAGTEAAAASAIWDMGSIVTGRLVGSIIVSGAPDTLTSSALFTISTDAATWSTAFGTAITSGSNLDADSYFIAPQGAARYLRFNAWRVVSTTGTAAYSIGIGFYTASAINTFPDGIAQSELISGFPSGELLATLQFSTGDPSWARGLTGFMIWR